MPSLPLVRAARAALPLIAASLTAPTPRIAHAQVTDTPVVSAPALVYDSKAEALLQHAADRIKAVQSLSGQVETIYSIPATATRPAVKQRAVKTFRLQKPNLVYQEIARGKKSADGTQTVIPSAQYVSDGKKGVWFLPPAKVRRALAVTKEALGESYALSFPEFFNPALSEVQQVRADKASGRLVSLTLAPDAVVGGVPCFVVEEKTLSSKDPKYSSMYTTTKIYIGKKDGLIRGSHAEWQSKGNGVVAFDTLVTDVALGEKLPPSTFALSRVGHLTDQAKYVMPKRPPLLKAETLAPDFTVYDRDGKALKLSDFRGKIVVLDFWATWCGPCLKSLPHTMEVAKKTADSGVVVLAVNVWDKQAEFDKWLPRHPEYAPLTFAIDTTPGKGEDVATKLYKVSGIPTQYVIDRDGKIVTAFVGFSGPTDDLEKAIAKVGAQK